MLLVNLEQLHRSRVVILLTNVFQQLTNWLIQSVFLIYQAFYYQFDSKQNVQTSLDEHAAVLDHLDILGGLGKESFENVFIIHLQNLSDGVLVLLLVGVSITVNHES